jgi:hypothetical protein
MKYIILLALTCICPLPCEAQVKSPATFNVSDFGAKGDGVGNDTPAFRAASEACRAAGGGVIHVPRGVFVTGSFELPSQTELQLTSGAIIRGSENLKDYDFGGHQRGLISAFEARHVSVKGSGKVEGSCVAFHDMARENPYLDFDRSITRQGGNHRPEGRPSPDGPVAKRPRPGRGMVDFIRCEQVVIEGITFKDSPNYTVLIGDCDGVRVSGVTILNNQLIPNSDGIHCATSRNVVIHGCHLVCGDDCIVFTGLGSDPFKKIGADMYPGRMTAEEWAGRESGNRTGRCENFVVSDCLLSSRSAGVRIGYGDNDMRNGVFQNLVLQDCNRGIGLFAHDLGSIENIRFNNIVMQTRLYAGRWWGAGEPVHVSSIPQKSGVPCGQVRDISFEGISATCEAGVLIFADEPGKLENLRFTDVQLRIAGGPLSGEVGGNFDLRPAADMRSNIFKHDIPGLFAQHVQGLNVSDFQLTWNSGEADYFSHGIELHHCTGVMLRSNRAPAAKHTLEPLLNRESELITP